MTPVSALVRNELRAVLPLAAAVVATLVAASLLGGRPLGLIVYCAGSMGVGAAMVGHELNHSTLGLLLVQPISRERVLRAKVLVTALALVAIGAAASVTNVLDAIAPLALQSVLVFQLPVFLTALFVAPWLTMITRNPMAGAVGALASPIFLLVVLSLTGLYDEADAARFRLLAMSLTTLAGIAGVLGYRYFTTQLEDGGGMAGKQIHFRLTPAARSRVRPDGSTRAIAKYQQLAGKELRLQQLPLVLAGLYAGACLLAWLTTGVVPGDADPRQPVMAWLFGGTTALLIGAVSSAEERQMGTMPWQVMVPVAAWRQFLLKTVLGVVLCAALAGGLPLVLSLTSPTLAAAFWTPEYGIACLALTLAGLYMSSLSTSSLRAFLTSLPAIGAIVVLMVLARAWSRPIGLFLFDATYPMLTQWLPETGSLSVREVNAVLLPALATLAAGLVILVWRFALKNHSRAENAGHQGLRQAVVLSTYVLVGASLVLAVEAAVVAGPSARSTISGIVVDEHHEPVPGVLVSLTRTRYLTGQRRLSPVGRGQTTDNGGRFRLTGLPEGAHLLVALTGGYTRTGQPAGYAPTFHPGTTTADVAVPVEVNGRTGVTGVTIELAPSRSVRLAGRVTDIDGQPVAGSQVWLSAVAAPDGVAPVFNALSESRANGTFEFQNMPSGEYMLQARSPRTPPGTVSPSVFAGRLITLTDTDVTNLEVTLRPGGTLRGTVVFEGNAPRPGTSVVRVSANQADLTSISTRSSVLNEDWTFEIGPMAGRYVVGATVLPSDSPWAVRDVRLAGRTILDTPLSFTRSEQIDGVQVVLTDRTGHITGSVRDADGRATSDYFVLIFPADPKGWEFPARQVHFVRPNTLNGFQSPPLLPGAYVAIAVSIFSDMNFDFRDPEFLAEVRPLATPVDVGVGDSADLQLRIAR